MMVAALGRIRTRLWGRLDGSACPASKEVDSKMRHSNPVVQFALRHGEKVFCGAAAAWLAVVGLSFAQQPDVIDQVDTLEQRWTFVERSMQTAQPEPWLVPDQTQTLRAQLDPEGVPALKAFPSWSMHKRPQFVFEVAEPDTPPLVFTHEPSKVLAVDVERGRVTVNWKPGKCSSSLIPSYTLERAAEGGDWNRIADLNPDDPALTDTTVAPETGYAYRVVSSAKLNLDDEIVQAHGATTFPQELALIVGDASQPITTPRNTIIVLNTVTPGDALRRRKGTAQVYVYQWNSELGAFERRLFQVQEGRKIGRGAFATGARLERVWIEARDVGVAKQPVGHIEFRRKGEPAETVDDRTPFQP